ncbi:hypothetical protein [Pseudomonas baetica]|uniref:hypothetical protein n=1 Tax=Pseudomonas baetica TaxID=674054 RepID=UPI002406134B|nr:hypothetical protein [Pseudomonas baetica]MDF9779101.1 hypothetical protein [Pseudomonas baetica]
MDALEDVEVVANLYRLSGTGAIHTVDDLKAQARVLMPGVGTEQLTRALRGLAIKLWDTNHGGFRNEYRRSRGRKRVWPQSLAVHH